MLGLPVSPRQTTRLNPEGDRFGPVPESQPASRTRALPRSHRTLSSQAASLRRTLLQTETLRAPLASCSCGSSSFRRPPLILPSRRPGWAWGARAEPKGVGSGVLWNLRDNTLRGGSDRLCSLVWRGAARSPAQLARPRSGTAEGGATRTHRRANEANRRPRSRQRGKVAIALAQARYS